MIRVDPRAGSKDLVAPLERRGLPVSVETLEFGDVSFTGHGPRERPVLLGIEHKTLSDLLGCLATKRYEGHQLVGLHNTYETAWLLVEGRWHTDTEGYLMEMRRGGFKRIAWGSAGMQRRTLMKKLFTFEHCGGVRVRVTQDRNESLDWIHAMYGWWVGKEFEAHGADIGWCPPEAWVAEAADSGSLRPWSGARQWARIVPGLGAKFAKAAAEHVGHVPEALAKVSEEEWAALQYDGGKKLGASKARAIRRWMRGER